MLSCFKCGLSARFMERETPTSASSTAHRCSPSSKERNYFNEMNKDPCSLIEEVKTHFNMDSFADTKYMDFSSEEKISTKSIDTMIIHGPQLAKEEDFVQPSNIALIQQLDCYREEKEQHVVSTFVSINGTICSAEDRKNGTINSAEDRKNGTIHITKAVSSMNTPMKEIFCSEEEKKKNLISSSIEDDSKIEDKELDSKEADKDILCRNLVLGPAMLKESGILENRPTEAILDSFADGKEILKKAIPEEGITCAMRVACDTDNHQDPESDDDEISMSDEASSIVEDGEEKQGAINGAHGDYNEYYKKGVITSPSELEPGASLFSYGISDQQRDFLFLCAGLVIQAVGFQLRSLVEVVTALILLCYRAYIFMGRITDTLSRAKQNLAERQTMLLSYVAIDNTRIAQQILERWESMKPLIIQGAKKMGWGCLTAAYVIAMLSALLLTSLLFSYLAVKGGTATHEKPIQITRELYFDYTKAHPETSLDLFSLDAYSRMSNATKGIKVNPGAGLRYRCTILLTLPESDHNRKLGVFQVRSEVVSEKGERVGKGSQPCMLLFQSNTVHYVKSMVMAIPLLTGLASESQTLRLHLLEWPHVADTSSSARFLQIVLVPRAGSSALPQLYKAHLLLHSLPAPSSLPSSSRSLKTLFMWLLLSFLIFGCLSTFCMYRMHHNKI